jgi:hypothetical protein
MLAKMQAPIVIMFIVFCGRGVCSQDGKARYEHGTYLML